MRHFGEKLKIFGVESFAAYVFSRRICLLEFFIVFKLIQNVSVTSTALTTVIKMDRHRKIMQKVA